MSNFARLAILSFLFADVSLAFRLPPISDELGCSPTLSVLFGRDPERAPLYFDPLGIATDGNFCRLREGELKSSRITMLIVTQSMIVPFIKRTTNWLPKDAPEGILASLKALTVGDLAKVFVTCGLLETFVFIQRDLKDMPGDYGFGYFGVRDKGAHERKLVVELENGRLAMIAFLVQVLLEQISGESWVDQWSHVFSSLSHTTQEGTIQIDIASPVSIPPPTSLPMSSVPFMKSVAEEVVMVETAAENFLEKIAVTGSGSNVLVPD